MGNNTANEVKMSELSTIRGAERFLNMQDNEEVLEAVYCCCFRIGRRSKELWKKNLEMNFKQLERSVIWIKFFQQVYKDNRHNRQDDLLQLYNMKIDWEQRTDTIRDPHDYTHLVEKSIIVGSILSKKNQIRKSISLKQRTSVARSIIVTRSSRSPVKNAHRQSSLENIGEIFANKKYYFDKQTADSMFLFTLFCDLIQKHFKTTDTLFYRMKDTFVDYIANNSYDGESLIADIHQYIRLTWETVVDYYKVEDLDGISGNNSFFTEQNMETLITSILFRNSIIHGRVFQYFVEKTISKQRELQATISKLRNATPESMQIKHPYCLTQSTVKWFQKNHNYNGDSTQIFITQPYESCIVMMKQLEDTRTPAGKLKLLVQTADLIIDCINKFYQKRGMQTKLQALDADQILCIYSYILVKSRIKNLNAHLDIIQMFSSEGQLLSETGYYFSVVSTALQSLVSVVL